MLAYKLAHVSLALRIITLKLATWELSACNSKLEEWLVDGKGGNIA